MSSYYLARGRVVREWLIASAMTRDTALSAELNQARLMDRYGDAHDTMRLANVLTMVVDDAVERKDEDAVVAASGGLMAAMADVADGGDKRIAAGLNKAGDEVGLPIIEAARLAARKRRSRRVEAADDRP
jgi:hypothetical protein